MARQGDRQGGCPIDHRLVRAAALAADRDPGRPVGRAGDPVGWTSDPVGRASDPVGRPSDPVPPAAQLWQPAELAGRLCELAVDPHSVHLTLACSIIREFQHAAEPVVWVTTARATFFPPDMAHSGVDLAALPVVQVPDLAAVAIAADRLTRCGAFGLVLLELGAGGGGTGSGGAGSGGSRIGGGGAGGNGAGDGAGVSGGARSNSAGGGGSAPRPLIPAGLLGRLVRLARRHDTALLCLTTPDTTLGSLVSLRGRGFRHPIAVAEPGYVRCGIHVLKDRRRPPGASLTGLFRAPYGLC